MILGLRGKLIAAMVFVTLASAAIVGIWTQRFTQQQFERFLEVETIGDGPEIDIEPILEHHDRFGSWDGVEPLIAELLPGKSWLLFDATRNLIASNAPEDPARSAELDPDGNLGITVRRQVGDSRVLERTELRGGLDLLSDGRSLGWLFVLPPAPDPLADSPEIGFARRVARVHYRGIGVAALMALLFAWFFSRRIVGPVERLTLATRGLALGNLGQRVPPSGNDEIAELTRSFNAMAQTIERNEELRRHMVSDVAHELRTPLTHLRCKIETVQDGLAPLDGELLSSLHDEIVHLARLVDDLQDLALAEAGRLPLHPVSLTLGTVVRQVANSLPALEDSRRILVEVAEPLPNVYVDPDRLRQVLRNLLENARRHTPQPGMVTVAAWSEKGRVVCEVRDDGEGIAAEHLDRVFERFYRTDPARSRGTGGVGLGLPIVRQLVQAWGGSIEIHSEPGHGTRVRFNLPVSAEDGL